MIIPFTKKWREQRDLRAKEAEQLRRADAEALKKEADEAIARYPVIATRIAGQLGMTLTEFRPFADDSGVFAYGRLGDQLYSVSASDIGWNLRRV